MRPTELFKILIRSNEIPEVKNVHNLKNISMNTNFIWPIVVTSILTGFSYADDLSAAKISEKMISYAKACDTISFTINVNKIPYSEGLKKHVALSNEMPGEIDGSSIKVDKLNGALVMSYDYKCPFSKSDQHRLYYFSNGMTQTVQKLETGESFVELFPNKNIPFTSPEALLAIGIDTDEGLKTFQSMLLDSKILKDGHGKIGYEKKFDSFKAIVYPSLENSCPSEVQIIDDKNVLRRVYSYEWNVSDTSAIPVLKKVRIKSILAPDVSYEDVYELKFTGSPTDADVKIPSLDEYPTGTIIQDYVVGKQYKIEKK